MPADIGYDWSALSPEQKAEAIKRSGRARTPEDVNRFMAAAEANPEMGNQLLISLSPGHKPVPVEPWSGDDAKPEPPPAINAPGNSINSPAEFDKRFVEGPQAGPPVDDEQLMRMILARRRMLDGGQTPLQGDVQYDLWTMGQPR